MIGPLLVAFVLMAINKEQFFPGENND